MRETMAPMWVGFGRRLAAGLNNGREILKVGRSVGRAVSPVSQIRVWPGVGAISRKRRGRGGEPCLTR